MSQSSRLELVQIEATRFSLGQRPFLEHERFSAASAEAQELGLDWMTYTDRKDTPVKSGWWLDLPPWPTCTVWCENISGEALDYDPDVNEQGCLEEAVWRVYITPIHNGPKGPYSQNASYVSSAVSEDMSNLGMDILRDEMPDIVRVAQLLIRKDCPTITFVAIVRCFSACIQTIDGTDYESWYEYGGWLDPETFQPIMGRVP